MNSSTNYQINKINFDEKIKRVKVHWQDGHKSQFPYIWLRHKMFFPAMGRPGQGDLEYLIPEKSEILRIKSITQNEDAISIEWQHDRSITDHKLKFLRDNCLTKNASNKRQLTPKLWDADDSKHFSWFDVSELENPEMRMEVYLHLRDFGIALVKNISVVPGTVEQLTSFFGPARNTHFGTLFDIRSLPQDNTGTGKNIGATASNTQALHTDEGWRHGPPGISLFHCLKSHRDGGGASFFVDGIAAATILQKSSPVSFEILSSVALLTVAERNLVERFRSRGRLIALDTSGTIRGVRISDRNFPEVDLPENQIEPVYNAIREFLEILYAPNRIFEHQLQPGEMVIFDNHRVLHARRSFDPNSGERWLQQLSIDREEFHNQFRQLAESLGRMDLAQWEPDAGALSQS